MSFHSVAAFSHVFTFSFRNLIYSVKFWLCMSLKEKIWPNILISFFSQPNISFMFLLDHFPNCIASVLFLFMVATNYRHQ